MSPASRVKVRARFVGPRPSMGYIPGRVYELTIVGNDVTRPHPCPYSVAGFLANWRIIGPQPRLEGDQ